MGIDTNIFKPYNKDKAREKLGLPKDKKIILFSGSLIKRKGVKYLINAVNDLDVLLLIIGGGKERNKLENISNSNVKFLGYKSNKLMPLYLSSADVYAMPSLWEGACISLMEAFSCDIPVVATDVGNARELISNNTGIIVKKKNIEELRNAIIYVLNNPNKFKGMRNTINKNYDWKVICKRTLDIYKKLH